MAECILCGSPVPDADGWCGCQCDCPDCSHECDTPGCIEGEGCSALDFDGPDAA